MIITENHYQLTSSLLASLFNIPLDSFISLRIISNDEDASKIGAEIHLVSKPYQPVTENSTLLVSGEVEKLFLMLSSQQQTPIVKFSKEELLDYLDWYLNEEDEEPGASEFWPINRDNFMLGHDFWKRNLHNYLETGDFKFLQPLRTAIDEIEKDLKR